MTEAVLTEDADGVLVITLNRPEAKNAVNHAVAEGMAAALDELESRDDLTLAIITGAGGTFSAGMDLKAFLTGEDPTAGGRGFAGICQKPPRKPLIAAVEGWALAGGCEIALSCDLIVAAEDAKFGIPEVKRSLVAAAGGLLRLPRRLPPSVAMELALTGDPLSAADAHRYGLVNSLAPSGGALDAARALAARIVPNGPLALVATKQIMAAALDWTIDEGFERQGPIMAPVFTSEDSREGARAFAEKRPPVWKGR
ncbi:MAG TPA: crotonase/enoyl-CoA hydratase family protein [Jatrophihabitans sp.]|jgi:enoyl-CoA hydratase|uniref:crotonase/enoyl-CoA hydratase family protein n=1 Tax=Jatrophihabitans sp. TaxID=1932789 RepID=UPI002E07E025|nr:crotonase/enoyl-CoA hydratase family protein [Jatrophihabitans sp.]